MEASVKGQVLLRLRKITVDFVAMLNVIISCKIVTRLALILLCIKISIKKDLNNFY